MNLSYLKTIHCSYDVDETFWQGLWGHHGLGPIFLCALVIQAPLTLLSLTTLASFHFFEILVFTPTIRSFYIYVILLGKWLYSYLIKLILSHFSDISKIFTWPGASFNLSYWLKCSYHRTQSRSSFIALSISTLFIDQLYLHLLVWKCNYSLSFPPDFKAFISACQTCFSNICLLVNE